MTNPSKNGEQIAPPISHACAILSLNRALWREVTPPLRSAKIKWDADTVYLYFFYDGEISEDDHESAECAATEVIANFPDYQLEVNILRWDYPKPVPQEGLTTVYYRKEPKPPFVD